MEIPNLFKTIIDKAVKTGYLTLDELAILRSDSRCWLWLTDYLTVYRNYNPILMSNPEVKKEEAK